MMINIVLYNENSVINIAKRATKYLSKQALFRTTSDSIWISGLYLKFSSNLIVANNFATDKYSQKQLCDCLLYILEGEEVFVSSEKYKKKYIETVSCSTDFDNIFTI